MKLEKIQIHDQKVLKVSGALTAQDRQTLLNELAACANGSSVRIDLSAATRFTAGFAGLLRDIESRTPRPEYHVRLSEGREFFVDINI